MRQPYISKKSHTFSQKSPRSSRNSPMPPQQSPRVIMWDVTQSCESPTFPKRATNFHETGPYLHKRAPYFHNGPLNIHQSDPSLHRIAPYLYKRTPFLHQKAVDLHKKAPYLSHIFGDARRSVDKWIWPSKINLQKVEKSREKFSPWNYVRHCLFFEVFFDRFFLEIYFFHQDLRPDSYGHQYFFFVRARITHIDHSLTTHGWVMPTNIKGGVCVCLCLPPHSWSLWQN